MIRSFKNNETERIFLQIPCRRFSKDIQYKALKKLIILNSAENETDLVIPHSNHFENLKGNRKGECSIRINDKWRICFRFENGNAYDVSIEDYH
jgi:toxin HigB-1